MDWSIVEEAISRAHAVSVDSCHNITIWTGSRRPNYSGDGVLTKSRANEAQMLAAVKEWWGDACLERQITEIKDGSWGSTGWDANPLFSTTTRTRQ